MSAITLTTITGQAIHTTPANIVRVTDGYPADAGARTHVHGPTDAAIVMDGDPAQFVAQVGTRSFAKLTRPDGSRVWISPGSVSAVRLPQPDEARPDGSVNAVAIAAGAKVLVKERVQDVLAAIGW